MDYNIRHLDNLPKGREAYFLDANIWLLILKPQINPKNYEIKYITIFEKFKNGDYGKVAVTALLFSEIINRYIRDVSYEKFLLNTSSRNVDKSHYKKVYRTNPVYKKDYQSLIDDIAVYSDLMEPIDDCFKSKDICSQILNNPSPSLDFNDQHFCHLAQEKKLPIITHDSDYLVPNLEIYTLNRDLIDRGNQKVTLIGQKLIDAKII